MDTEITAKYMYRKTNFIALFCLYNDVKNYNFNIECFITNILHNGLKLQSELGYTCIYLRVSHGLTEILSVVRCYITNRNK